MPLGVLMPSRAYFSILPLDIIVTKRWENGKDGTSD
jgi:hypothetical protein